MWRLSDSCRPRAGSRRGSALLVLVTVVLASSACATKRDFRDLRTELNAQSERQDSLFASIMRSIDAIGDSLSTQSDQDFEFRGEVARELLSIQDQLIQVQEMSGVNQRTLSQLRDEVEARRSALDEAPAQRGSMGQDDGAEEAFQAATDAYERRSNTAARLGFQQFVEQYPNHERVVEAQYYLADILQQDGDLDAAVAAFERIPELYPADALAADALYRVGVIELDRGDADAARAYFQRVITGYPDSAAAEVARERLSEIGEADGLDPATATRS